MIHSFQGKCCWTSVHQHPFCLTNFSAFDSVKNFVFVRLPRPPKKQRPCVWEAPSDGVLKFNVDGSARVAPGLSGINGVVCDSSREILGFFSKCTGELWAYEM